MAQRRKSAVITFLGNAYHDSRVVNLIQSLTNLNMEVFTISFDWKSKGFKTITGKTNIYKLTKSGISVGYYLKFIFLLIRDLFKVKPQIYFAEDIYTLPFVYYFARLNKAKLFYNSREIYAHLAGLRNRSLTQSIISKIENRYIRKVDLVLVTGEMDADYLQEAYSINNLFVLRNLPKYKSNVYPIDLRSKLNIPNKCKIILYQGVILEGRGIQKIIDLMNDIPNVHFVIIGDGEFKDIFKRKAENSLAKDRIHFIDAVEHSSLLGFTMSADLGLALIENISISYYYALPNKLFEYIMAGLPVLTSNLPQMEKIVDGYEVGRDVDPENEKELISILNELLSDDDKLARFRQNSKIAAKELNWDNEFKKFNELHLN